jgi:GNAT superfamily N-acetyltransferase
VGPTDIDFVFDSWLRSYFHYLKTKTHFQNRELDPNWKDPLLDIQVFFPEHRRIIENLDATVLLAVNPEDTEQIYGWMCASHPNEEAVILHYCFVKQPFRHLGISKELLKASLKEKSRVFYTHFTHSGKEYLFKNLGECAIYNPYMMRPR